MLMDGCVGVRGAALSGREVGSNRTFWPLGLFIPNYCIPCRKPDGPDQEENKFTLGRETLERVSSE